MGVADSLRSAAVAVVAVVAVGVGVDVDPDCLGEGSAYHFGTAPSSGPPPQLVVATSPLLGVPPGRFESQLA